jgi:PTS system mannose-specific IID component
LIPQVFLLGLTVTSASVILLVTYSLSATALGMLPKLEIAFNTVGILLVMLAAASATLWFKSRYNILIFAIAYLVSVFLSFDIYLVLIVLLLFSIQKLAVKDSEKRKQKRIQNKDLIKSWFIWMNFSDSCFNFEFAQGISFCQSIKPALNRIYKGDREGREAATIRHFDFFKGDPILSTSVIGHMIGVEEKKASDKRIKEITIADAKKGAMGAIASTEVMERQSAVAAIIILGMIYGVVSNEISFFVLSTLIMIGMTHYLSLKNMFDGYFLGEDGIIKSVNRINEIRIFKHAGKIFVIMLGLVVGEAIFNMLYSIQATNFRNGAASLLILFVLFNYLIRKNIKIELIVLALYGLNIVLLMFI